MNKDAKHAIVRTGSGSIMIGNTAPETVTLDLDLDDMIDVQRPLLLEINEAHQVIDALQNAIRRAQQPPSSLPAKETGTTTR